jgi:hypothetical protein
MNVKSTIQLSIFLILIFFLIYIFKTTFFLDRQEIVNLDLNNDVTTDKIDKIEDKKELSNTIENLSYKSIDANGNEYILNADSGEIKIENKEVIILKKVTGIINLKNKSKIYINSDIAKYNTKTYDTFFYQNVYCIYEDSKINSDNIDLSFKDNKAIIYDNIKFFGKNLNANADKILVDLLNGDIKITMKDKEKKIKITKK